MNDHKFVEGKDSEILQCSMCGKPYEPAIVTTRPFCSLRCQQIDLKNWFDESYSLPMERDIEYDDAAQEENEESSD